MNRSTISEDKDYAATIATQNDSFRAGIVEPGEAIPGRVVSTPGIRERGPDFVLASLRAVAAFDSFSTDNDPHSERDFGAIKLQGERLFWKIDLYDVNYHYGSEKRDSLDVTRRVLTIMLASEY